MILDDFKASHHLWDRERKTSMGTSLANLIYDLDLAVFHSNDRSNSIDLTITNRNASTLVINWRQLPFGIFSDHSPQLFTLNRTSYIMQRSQMSPRIFRENDLLWEQFTVNFDPFMMEKTHRTSLSLQNPTDIDKCVDIFTSTVVSAAYHSLPIKHPVVHKPKIKPIWWDNEIDTLHHDVRRFKHKLQRATSVLTKSIFRERYLSLKQKLECAIKLKSEKSWISFINDGGDPNEGIMWGNAYKFIKSRLSPDTSSVPILRIPPNDITETVKNILSSLFPSSAPSISHQTLNEPSTRPNNSCVSFSSADHLLQLIRESGNGKAPGIDGITNSMLKHIPPQMFSSLLNIISKCIELGHFPSPWKNSSVRIIPKIDKPDYTTPSAYRPISLTSNVSKLLEKVINFYLTKHLEENNIICNSQYGFRKGKSVTDAINRIMELIPPHSSKKSRAIISFDFKSAFDNAPHELILSNLTDANTPINIIKVIESFLKNRSVTLKLDCSTIHHHPSGKGCPQGCVISPTLWNIVINPLLMKLNSSGLNSVAYADDLTVICAKDNDTDLNKSIEDAIQLVTTWARSTRIPLNNDKSNILPIGIKRIPVINDGQLKVVSETKILGVTFTPNLRFDRHCELKLPKAWSYLYKLSNFIRHRYGFSAKHRIMAYNSYIKPFLLFASEVWGSKINKKTITNLIRLESAILRNAIHGFKSTSFDSIRAITKTPYVSELIKIRGDMYNRTDLTTYERRSIIKEKIKVSIDKTTERCRPTVIAAVNHKNFSTRLPNIAFTTLITQHGPTREYLCKKKVIGSDLCPICNKTESYLHIITECNRFVNIRNEFNISQDTTMEMLIDNLMSTNKFSKFCQLLYEKLRFINNRL